MLKPTTAPASYTIEHDRSLQIPVAYPQHEGCWWGVERAIVVSRFSKARMERLITLFSRAGPLSWPVLLIGAPLVLACSHPSSFHQPCKDSPFTSFPATSANFAMLPCCHVERFGKNDFYAQFQPWTTRATSIRTPSCTLRTKGA